MEDKYGVELSLYELILSEGFVTRAEMLQKIRET